MPKHGKNYKAAAAKVESAKLYSPKAAMELAKELAPAKFDETVEVAVRLGVDALPGRCVEGELAYHEDIPSSIQDAAVHHAVSIVEDAQVDRLLAEPVDVLLCVGFLDAHEDEHAAPDG